jgi:CHAT domain-containing protein
MRALTTRLAETKAEYLKQVQAFLGRYPQYKARFVDQQTVDPKVLAKFADRLPPGTLAVQYFAAPDTLYLFVVAPGGRFAVKRRAVSQADLYALVREYRRHVEQGATRHLAWADDGSEAWRGQVAPLRRATATLAQHLLEPIAAELDAHPDLVVVPNDLLLYLPIHALTRASPDGTPRFLAETHRVSYVTQLELFDLLAPPPSTTDAPLLAFANPDGTLPAASLEVRALRGIRPMTTALEGAQATKAAFLARAGRFPDFHLATHGVLDPRRPEDSYLLLAGADEASQRLGIDEISGLSLGRGLAILSACETAVGEQVPGAALITLAAAFSQAGAQSVIASLWKVNDRATRDFMVALHTALHKGSRAAALQHAQRAVLGAGRTAHPFYWAPFVLIGAR